MCPTDVSLTSRAARAAMALAEDVVASARVWTSFAGLGTGAQPEVEPAVAATALLLEVAYADERFSKRERAVVECTLHQEYGLGPVRVDRLVRAAERARHGASGPWVFTGVLVSAFTPGQRARFAEIMERLVSADGEPEWSERYVVDKLHALLRVEVAHV